MLGKPLDRSPWYADLEPARERLRERGLVDRALFLSGYSDEAVDGRGLLAAGSAFLHKPFNLARLAVKVHEALELPRQEGPEAGE